MNGENSEPAIPASKSPSRTPPATTRMFSALSRPRSESGTIICCDEERNTAEITSAAPAVARNAHEETLANRPEASMFHDGFKTCVFEAFPGHVGGF